MKTVLSALAISAAMLFGTAQANATITVDFSITGSNLEPGTVTGHLTFDSAGTGVKATGVYIDSAPSRFFLFSDDNLVTALHNSANAFTVSSDGTITSADMYLFGNSSIFGGDPAQASAGVTGDYFELNDFGNNSYQQEFAYPYPFGSSFSAVANSGGFGGVTYTPAVAQVPEPAEWSMLILGFGLAGGALRQRRATIRTAVTFG